MRDTIVVSGIGILVCNGWDLDSFGQSLREGRSGITEITLFDAGPHRTKVAGEVRLNRVSDRLAKEGDRALAFSDYTIEQALTDARLSPEMLKNKIVSVCLGTISTGWSTFQETYSKFKNHREIRKEGLNFSANILTDHVCAKFDITGPKYTPSTACSSTNTAIGLGYDLITYGLTDIAITGGVDLVTEHTHAVFNALRALTPDTCRPFDLNRSGFALGEGAGILILERLDGCLERQVQPHAEILGYGSSCDAYHITSPDPSGEGAAHAMKTALIRGGIAPTEVDYINAHGTATPQNDVMETKAIKQVFGNHAYKVPISSIKPLLGHTLAAAGVIETIATIIMMKEGFLVPTHDHETPDPDCDLNYLTDGVARDFDVKVALTNAFGFGGANCCIAMRRIG